jgi:RNA polymerase sigma-70 factor (ECF subfamily)
MSVADVEALFAEHRGSLFRYLCRAVGHTETARDLTQDVFLRVTRAANAVPAGPEARPWLFTIARNLVLDHHRRHRRDALQAGQPAAASAVASQDTGAVVNQALAQLSALDRDVFLMREMGGLGYDEIAKVCELSPDAVRSRIHRARLQLREWLSTPIRACRTEPMRQRTRNT